MADSSETDWQPRPGEQFLFGGKRYDLAKAKELNKATPRPAFVFWLRRSRGGDGPIVGRGAAWQIGAVLDECAGVLSIRGIDDKESLLKCIVMVRPLVRAAMIGRGNRVSQHFLLRVGVV